MSISLLLASVVGACDTAPTEPGERTEPEGPTSMVDARALDAELVSLDGELPWYQWWAGSVSGFPADSDGVIVFEMGGERYYHPVQIAQKGLAFVHQYRLRGDSVWLDHAQRFARRLLLEADTVQGGLYYPYRYDFDLHGIPGETERAVWYSGMAQSQVLSLLVRLYEITADRTWLDAAGATAKTLVQLRGANETWVSRVDADGYYWIEEYPMDDPARTLNGFMFATLGAYDYWRLTGDADMERAILASLATVRHYMPEFRVPGAISRYCLKHGQQLLYYHGVHIEQLRYMEQISGDPYFGAMADSLASDVE